MDAGIEKITEAATAAAAVAASTTEAAMVAWRASLTGSLIRFGILTAIFIGIIIAFVTTGNIKSVVADWPRHRCSPLMLPFAEFFGYDAAQNFQFCIRNMMQNQSGEFFTPMYALLGQYGSSLGMVVNTINGFRQMLGNFKLSTDMFVNGVMAKIQSLLFQVRMTFMRMQTLMGRVYGTMYSIIWMGTSAITAGTSLSDNSLVNFMFEFCFAPDTQIRLHSGKIVAIKDIQVGDVLEDGIRVESTFRFSGHRTPMVRIGSDVLSAEHRVQEEGRWIPASQHSAAVPTSSLPVLICMNVAGHAFRTAAGLQVADYDESSNPATIREAQHIAECALNGWGRGRGSGSGTSSGTSSVENYSLGLDAEADIWMSDNTWKPLKSLQLGDTVHGGAEIVGLVEEECRELRNYGGLLVSAAQLIYVDGCWRRAATIPGGTEAMGTSALRLLQCITDRAAPLFLRNAANKAPIVVRDYREAAVPDMETPYIAALEEQN